MDIYSSIFTLFSASSGALFTFWFQRKLTEQKNNLELRAKKIELEYERNRQALEKLEIKIEEAHIIASELGREFSLTFLNIDWKTNMAVSEYDAKYRVLCNKCAKLKMIVDLYAPTLSEEVSELASGMNMYWGNFRNVLSQTNEGKRPNELGSIFDEAVKYSRQVPEQAYGITNQLSDYYRAMAQR